MPRYWPGPPPHLKCPFIVTRYATVFLPAGEKEPGMAEASAFSWVVTTADIHDGTASPFSLASRSAIAFSRGIAEAGTAGPGTATADRSPVNRTLPQPAIIGPASTAATHGSVTKLHLSLAVAHLAPSISPGALDGLPGLQAAHPGLPAMPR